MTPQGRFNPGPRLGSFGFELLEVGSSMPWSRTDYAFFFLHELLGLLFINAALFLYEDEEGRIQNKVEEWWIKLNDKGKASRSLAAAFMQEVAKLTGRGFDRLLGKRLLSLRFIFISISFSLASIFLFVFVLFPLVHNPPAGTSAQAALRLFLFFAAFGLVPAFTKSKVLLGLWWGLIVLTLVEAMDFILFVFSTRGAGPAARGVSLVMLVFGFSLLCDLSYIVTVRWLLRRISQIDRVYEIVLQVLVNLLILAILMLGPIFLCLGIGRFSVLAGEVFLYSFVLNSLNIVVAFAALTLASLLLLHRLLWPTIERPIYAIQRFALLKNKKLLWGIGICLIFLPTHTSIELLKSILAKL